MIALVLTAVQTWAGITYQLRSVTAKGVILTSTVWASGDSFRTEMEHSEDAPELNRQYPIAISNDGGRTIRALRPENHTWYEHSNNITEDVTAIGRNAKLLQPSVTLVEETSDEKFAGMKLRSFVLKVSYIVESDIESEKIRVHETRTVLFLVADLACAPTTVGRMRGMRFGATELNEAVNRKLDSIDGFIVRMFDSSTERYEGGAVRTFQSTMEVIRYKCLEIDPSLFAIPKGYSYQEIIVGGPGQ
jgi:hypothetical protein